MAIELKANDFRVLIQTEADNIRSATTADWPSFIECGKREIESMRGSIERLEALFGELEAKRDSAVSHLVER